jgi:hypothetical protein
MHELMFNIKWNMESVQMQDLRYISVFENQLYVVAGSDINTLHKFDAANYTTLARNLTSPFAVHVYHRQRQPHGISLP